VLLAGAGLALGQAPHASAPPAVTSGQPVVSIHMDDGVPMMDDGCACSAGNRLWVSADYLLWWIKDGPLPSALVTTGDPNTDNPGALGHGGAPLFGDKADLGTFSGVRVTAGGWCDCDQTLGIEGSGFVLSRRVQSFRAESDANGNPVIAFRYLDPPDAKGVTAEDAFQASVPAGNPFGVGPLAGGVAVVSTSRLWGAEANAVLGFRPRGNLRLEGLAGFRYLELDENLDLSWHSQALDGATVPFLGGMFAAPSLVTSNDNFHAKTHFYGGQVGLRGEYGLGKAFVGFSGKVALGDSHEVVNVSGGSSLLPAGGTLVTATAGQFAGPSNIGRLVDDSFAVVPEVEVKGGYNVTEHLRAFVGYDFLYWSRVVRPGNQVDLIVDDRQNPVNPGFDPTNPTTFFPRPLIQRSNFWAQGINFGLEFTY
jgi:hypothetical protein